MFWHRASLLSAAAWLFLPSCAGFVENDDDASTADAGQSPSSTGGGGGASSGGGRGSLGGGGGGFGGGESSAGGGGGHSGGGAGRSGGGGGRSGSGGGSAGSGGGSSGSGGGSSGSGGGSSGSGGGSSGSGGGSSGSGGGSSGSGGGSSGSGGGSSGGYAKTGEGFYKELFMDVGVGLDDSTVLPAADQLQFRWEFVSGESTDTQHSYMTGNGNDSNGVLLYPDREPRFMLIYTGGGYGDHAGPVGTQGIKNVRDFFYNGGSYVGTCNGNYLAWSWGYNFWPGQMNTDSFEGRVNGVIPENSPILRYYDFGGDHLIKGLEHYSGGYATGTLPAGTEVLLVGKSASTGIDGDGHPTGWAYKPKATSGRLCGLADHPEYATQKGEVMNYLAAAFHYAYDGVAEPDVKAALASGVERVMNKKSEDNDLAYSKIGDKQYHHYTVSVADGVSELVVTVTADDRYHMNLYATRGTFAFASRATHSETANGGHKTLTVTAPEPGTWYIGVECATTVTASKTSTGYVYSGNLEVLNGVEYSVKATWK